ncbi:hypothetical protein HPB48_010287 [Haemaphysalis longicornis]|uniref:PDZ domain-containing protein n=1 Tax=Haemaphysalis longicornis TaxID=44386 RepID=A0A9J6FSV0_HAELO|nr:hypothetical protein HPB48_010287 [Haemaphysalis longicornis]
MSSGNYPWRTCVELQKQRICWGVTIQSLVFLVRGSMTNKENYKIADADALFDAVQLYIDSSPPCDQNRLSPRHAIFPRAALSTVQDFVETTIVLRKERNELGISITGGSDTYLEAICVSEVHRDGVAYQDGRLKKGDVILAGDQILEINGQNVRESNQKDVAQMIHNLDGAIVLLLGRVPSLSTAIQEWARKKAQQSLRTRTSTWSSYTGNNKEKLQIQRPSLPLSSESYVVSLGNCVTSMLVATSTPSGPASRSREVSPSSSLRRSRLSIVAEDVRPSGGTGVTRTTSLDDASSPSPSGLPSIMVTSC